MTVEERIRSTRDAIVRDRTTRDRELADRLRALVPKDLFDTAGFRIHITTDSAWIVYSALSEEGVRLQLSIALRPIANHVELRITEGVRAWRTTVSAAEVLNAIITEAARFEANIGTDRFDEGAVEERAV